MTDEARLRVLLDQSRQPWIDGDLDSIIERSIGAGFGYRTRATRLLWAEQPDGRERLEVWYDSLEYMRMVPGETNVVVDGDVAIVYGFFTEEFRHKGGAPQVVTVRFSNTAARRDGDWVFVWAHRDATPFDDAGQFVASR